ncbi:MAG: hypothetical protein IPM54_43820 [Polyangiaceae bacterium]|nr:hypothetical protein [Polyangiaceae bacterium]
MMVGRRGEGQAYHQTTQITVRNVKAEREKHALGMEILSQAVEFRLFCAKTLEKLDA